MGGSCWRQVPSLSAVALKAWRSHAPLRPSSVAQRDGAIVVVTVAPGAVKPQTTACCGSRCRTM